MQQIILTAPKEKLANCITTVFLTRLIRESYDQGNNDFVLNTQDTQIDGLASDFRATNLKLTIKGNTGHYYGYNSQGCNFVIEGDVNGWGGYYSRNCTYLIKGNAGNLFGLASKDCYCFIKGDVGEWCGNASKGSIYIIEGDVDRLCGRLSKNGTYIVKGNIGPECGDSSTNCTFKTSNKETYENMLKWVPQKDDKGQPTNNKVELIQNDRDKTST